MRRSNRSNNKNHTSTREIAYEVVRYRQIVGWNRVAAQTFGYAEFELLGQRCWELLFGRDVFGNWSCCEGCSVRATSFSDETINHFQADFNTAVTRFPIFVLPPRTC